MQYPLVCTQLAKGSSFSEVMNQKTPPGFARTTFEKKRTKRLASIHGTASSLQTQAGLGRSGQKGESEATSVSCWEEISEQYLISIG